MATSAFGAPVLEEEAKHGCRAARHDEKVRPPSTLMEVNIC